MGTFVGTSCTMVSSPPHALESVHSNVLGKGQYCERNGALLKPYKQHWTVLRIHCVCACLQITIVASYYTTKCSFRSGGKAILSCHQVDRRKQLLC
jgi:hypothetical protein